jgi:hypothetical protein
MNNSIYAPPQADLTLPVKQDVENAFYVVSARKFTILFFATIGMYQFYWVFKHWSFYKARAPFDDSIDRNIWPLPRAIFAMFFVHSLYREVNAYAALRGREIVSTLFQPTLLVLLLLTSGILDRMSWKEILTPYSDVLSLVMLVPLWFVACRAQRHINACCGDAEGSSNNELTGANIAWIVFGIVLWMLVIIGTLSLFFPIFEELE